MITDICQRWTHRRCAWRPAGEAFDPRRFEVAPIARDREARAFVEAHHYSGSYPAARVRFGLYEGPDLVGVAVFSQPMRDASLAPFGRDVAAELGRFVLLDRVPGNAESWMLAAVTRQFKHGGNHKYFLPLTKAARRAVEGRAEEYPKLALRNACQMGARPFLTAC